MLYKILTILFFIFSSTSYAHLLVTGAGASFPAAIYSKWAEHYYQHFHVKINYQAIGSGGGIKQISLGTVDFATTDRPLNSKELEDLSLVQFPVLFGAVVIAVNLPELGHTSLKLNAKVLKNIFLGKIHDWSDEQIQTLNPTIKLPHLPITLVHRADGSGTTYIFTQYLSKVSGEWSNRVGCGMAVKWPSGIGGKGNEGVALYLKSIPGAIAYLEYVYKNDAKLNLVQLQNKSNQFLSPTYSSISAAAKQMNPSKVSEGVVNMPGRDAWPLTGTSYMLIPKEIHSNKKEIYLNLFNFLQWCFTKGQEDAKGLGFILVPTVIQSEIFKQFTQIIDEPKEVKT